MLAYAAGAWVLLQVLGFATDTYGWPTVIAQLAMLGLTLGLPIVVTLAWYHGDRGQQRITALRACGTDSAALAERRRSVAVRAAQHRRPPRCGREASAALGGHDARPSIAVLPFENRSDREKDAFFVDGMHDDILTQLSKVGALKVISRTSVERFVYEA